MDDYLALEPLIKTRLDGLVSGVGIHSLATLGDERSRVQLAPGIFVGYAGDRRGDDVRGALQTWHQGWWTVIAVRSAKGGNTGQALRTEAGPLLGAVMQQLGGWTPDRKTYQPLARVAAAAPRYYIGYAEFPLRWETRITIRSTP